MVMDKYFQTVKDILHKEKSPGILNYITNFDQKYYQDSFFGTVMEKKPDSEDQNRMKIAGAFIKKLGFLFRDRKYF